MLWRHAGQDKSTPRADGKNSGQASSLAAAPRQVIVLDGGWRELSPKRCRRQVGPHVFMGTGGALAPV